MKISVKAKGFGNHCLGYFGILFWKVILSNTLLWTYNHTCINVAFKEESWAGTSRLVEPWQISLGLLFIILRVSIKFTYIYVNIYWHEFCSSPPFSCWKTEGCIFQGSISQLWQLLRGTQWLREGHGGSVG